MPLMPTNFKIHKDCVVYIGIHMHRRQPILYSVYVFKRLTDRMLLNIYIFYLQCICRLCTVDRNNPNKYNTLSISDFEYTQNNAF